MNPSDSIALWNAETLDDDGWALVAPFGEHEKTRMARVNGQVQEQKFIQVLDNATADQLLSDENSLFRRMKRAVVGIPVYKGHPDLRDHAPETLENSGERKEVVGVIDKVRKGTRGIEAHFSLAPAGARAVENDGCKFPSVLWMVTATGMRGDSIVARPFKLISAGLTPYPNISGVESLANARPTVPAETQTKTKNEPDMKMLIGWLIANGATALANASDATEAQVLAAFQQLHTANTGAVTALGNEKSTLAGKIITLENERDAALKLRDAEKKRADDAATVLANEQSARKAERKGRAIATVDLAIRQGKVVVADRDSKITALENAADEAAFTKAAEALMGGAAIVKVVGADVTSGRQEAALSNEAAQTAAEYDTAFRTELPLANQDAVKAHNAVMTKPAYAGLAAKLRRQAK